LALLTISSALGVVFCRNIVHSALCLVVTFIGVAGIYFTLQADYLALTQILVYGGAVSVLIVFAVMLIQRGTIKQTNLFSRHIITAGVIAIAMLIVIVRILLLQQWTLSTRSVPEETITGIAKLMLTRYAISFEITAVLLLVAMIAAIVIGKEVKESK
jgi:NADH-quinone oxidoreductase subunit J